MTPIVYMGSDEIGLPLLKDLVSEDSVSVVAVVTQPDRPSGRGKKLQPNPIAAWAQNSGLQVLKPEKPGKDTLQFFKDNAVELAIVMAYGHILSRDMLAFPSLGFVNLHTSALPAYRGASPIQTAMASMEKEIGVTLMGITPKMDTGPIIDVEMATVLPEDTGGSMYVKMANAAALLVKRNLSSILTGSAEVREQDENCATYARKLVKTDGQLDFNVTSKELAARIQAFDPWPGCYLDDAGTYLKVKGARCLDKGHDLAPGTILGCGPSGIEIATGHGVLIIESLQRQGGRILPVSEFLRGYPLEIGKVLSSQPMACLLSDKPFIMKGMKKKS